MRKALVMGISGGFGGAVGRALVRDGWSLRVLARDPAKMPAAFADAELIRGDAGDLEAVRRAARGTDLIVYGVNPPRYRWKGTAMPMLETLATVAEEQQATVLFPGNVYVFDPADGPTFDENKSMRPVTSKGALRKAMEERLRRATERGARVIVLRMGDYIGEHAPSAWLSVVTKRTAQGYTLRAPGPRDLPHTWAYLPDAARTAVRLAESRDQLPAWSVFHFRGHRASFNDIAAALRRASGKPVKVKSFPWWALRMTAPFSVLFRGLLEMRYLWNWAVDLDDSKLRHFLGEAIPETALEQAFIETGLAGAEPSQAGAPGPTADNSVGGIWYTENKFHPNA